MYVHPYCPKCFFFLFKSILPMQDFLFIKEKKGWFWNNYSEIITAVTLQLSPKCLQILMTTKIYINNHTVLPATKLCTSSFLQWQTKKATKCWVSWEKEPSPSCRVLVQHYRNPGWDQVLTAMSSSGLSSGRTVQKVKRMELPLFRRGRKKNLGLFGEEELGGGYSWVLQNDEGTG